jgi:transcriptional regulator with XRE-family HTH domain
MLEWKKGHETIMEVKQTTNRLMLYRKRMELSQKQVASLLGLKNIAILSHYERGTSRPSLQRALGLEIVYRVPIAFLFPDLYEEIRTTIREKESRMHRPMR